MNLCELDNVCQALHVLGDWGCFINEVSAPRLRQCFVEVYWRGNPFVRIYSDSNNIGLFKNPDNEEAHRLFRAFLEGMEEGGAFGVVHDFFSYWRREQRRDFVAKCKDALTLMCLRLYAHGRNKALCNMLDARLKELEKELD